MYCKQPHPDCSIVPCVADPLACTDIQDIHFLSISASKHNGRHADRRSLLDLMYHPYARDRPGTTVALRVQVW